MSQTHSEHGTIKAYVVGFVLSIIFTLIPYYLVVNKSFTGNGLLFTILTFAIIQMIIQITFFLHIGRGPKPNWNLFFFASTVAIILIVVGGSIIIINNLHYNMQPSDQIKRIINDENIYQVNGNKTGACQQLNTNHQIIILDGYAKPFTVTAKKCDSLTFINKDSASKNIKFNSTYAGETNLKIEKNKTETITLSETGTYSFYDTFNEATVGSFTVNAK